MSSRSTTRQSAAPERVLVDSAVLRDLLERVHSSERTVAQLEHALTSNRRIGIAVGVLMSRYQLTPDQGIRFLRRVSQERNVKVGELAEQVIGSRRPDASSLVTERSARVPPRGA